jgi:hypothetical protein
MRARQLQLARRADGQRGWLAARSAQRTGNVPFGSNPAQRDMRA